MKGDKQQSDHRGCDPSHGLERYLRGEWNSPRSTERLPQAGQPLSSRKRTLALTSRVCRVLGSPPVVDECKTLPGPRGGGLVGKFKCGPALVDLRLTEEDQIRPVVLPVRVIDPRVRSRERTGGPWIGRELGDRSEFPRAELVGVGACSDTPSAQAAQAGRRACGRGHHQPGDQAASTADFFMSIPLQSSRPPRVKRHYFT